MRRKTQMIIVATLLAAIMCSCRGMEHESVMYPELTQEVIEMSTEATLESTLQEEETQSTEKADTITVYSGAIEDYLLPLNKFSWERQYQPEYVMIHFTSAVVNDRNDPYNIDIIRSVFVDYEVSIHYIIERDGTIRCYIPEDRVAWHAGTGEYSDDSKYTNTMNQYAIGIEIVAIGSQADMEIYLTPEEYKALDQSLIGFTSEQYDALKALVEDICFRYDIPIDREHLIGHEDYSTEKKDPGELFDWDKILP